uniref:HpcH/HpaI aldolase/citrate lyase domain-containing protein n=1 Tax=Timema douglasi TaxID=61478 RepID=A0A7R8VHK6_TIMDO|nr:unnamed protein product [Timema douglasi]
MSFTVGTRLLYKLEATFHYMVRYSSSRRAVLYVPGDDTRKLNKALSLDADCIVMDCEDGVASNRKWNNDLVDTERFQEEARVTIRRWLDEGRASASTSEWSVRVNSVESGLCREDLQTVLGGANKPSTLLLPKVESKEHIEWFSDALCELVSGCRKINLIMYVESARAVLNLPDICRRAEQLSSTAPLKPAALVFGSDDLCASLGVTRSDDGTEILYARQKLVLVAKAFHLQAIDMVHIHFQACFDNIPDLDGLRAQCEAGARMGYTGKQVIHPGQIPIVQQAFMPAPVTVEWAEGLIAAFQEHQKIGKVRFYLNTTAASPNLVKDDNGNLMVDMREALGIRNNHFRNVSTNSYKTRAGGFEEGRVGDRRPRGRPRDRWRGQKEMESQRFEAGHGYDDENQQSRNQRVEAEWSGFMSDPMDGLTREDPD